MKEAQEGLLGNKGKRNLKEYKRRFDECQIKVKVIRNLTNILQKQCDNELEGDIKQVVREQSAELERDINEIKKMLFKLTRDYTDPASKSKIKAMWNQAGKQIERNKKVMEQFISKATASPSFLKSQEYEPYKKSKTEVNQTHHQQQSHYVEHKQKEGVSLVESQQIQAGPLMQQRILSKKAELIREIQERNCKINLLYNDMRLMVEGEECSLINDAQANLEARNAAANVNKEGNKVVKKQLHAKKKAVFMVILVILILLVALGIIYLFLR